MQSPGGAHPVHNRFAQRLHSLEIRPLAGVLFSVVSVVALPFGDLAIGDGALDVLLELALGLIATAVLWLVVAPGLAVLRRHRASWARQVLLVVLLIAGGIVRGLVILVLAAPFEYVSNAGIIQRLANSVSTTVLWLGVFALFVDAAARFSSRYDAAFTGLALSRASTVSDSSVAKILGSLESGLRGVEVPSSDEPHVREEMARVAASLEADIIARIKNQSRELWSFSRADKPRLRFFPLVRLAIKRLEYSVIFVVAVFGTVGVVNLTSTVGAIEALGRVGASVLLILGMDWLFRRVRRPSLSSRMWSSALYLITLGALVQIPMGVAGYAIENTSVAPLVILLLIIPTAALPVMDSTLNLADSAREELLKTVLSIESAAAADRDPATRSTADLASYLHNSLQSEIQSIVLALKSASSDPSRIEVGKASLERLRIIASKSLDEEFEAFSRAPLDHLAQVIKGWEGILDIELTWSTARQHRSDSRVATVVHIIEEVASNAAVHAGATAMDVMVTYDNDRFGIRISSDKGLGPLKAQGQGSAWLGQFVSESRHRSLGKPRYQVSYLV